MYRVNLIYAPLAQLVEQLTLNQWVLGSSPRWCTNWPVGQAAKTPASHAGNASSILARVTICHLPEGIKSFPSGKLLFIVIGPIAQLVRATGS